MAAERKSKKELHRTASPLKSESIQIPPKKTSDSNTCECLQTYSLPPSPNNTSIVPEKASTNTQVIDADRC